MYGMSADGLQTMAPTLSVEVIRDSVLPAMLQLAADPIPNIKFNVAKCLEKLASSLAASGSPEGHEVAQRTIVPALENLRNDKDADVRYFSTRALEKTLGVQIRCEFYN